jgi:hypothetical protein
VRRVGDIPQPDRTVAAAAGQYMPGGAERLRQDPRQGATMDDDEVADADLL